MKTELLQAIIKSNNMQTQFGLLTNDTLADVRRYPEQKLLARTRLVVESMSGTKQLTGDILFFPSLVWLGKTLPQAHEMSKYKDRLKQMLKQFPITVVGLAVENEVVWNTRYFDAQRYCDMLKIVCEECQHRGIKVATSGDTNGVAAALACEGFESIKAKATVDYIRKRNKVAGKNSDSLKRSKQILELIDKQSIPVDYMNWHYQLADSSYDYDMYIITKGYKGFVNRPTMNGELAQQDNDPLTTRAMIANSTGNDVVLLYGAGLAKPFNLDVAVEAMKGL